MNTYSFSMQYKSRATKGQLLALLQFMECHGDLGKSVPGLQGRIINERLWKKLAITLNNCSDTTKKTPLKWKKVWADWKSKTKKKASLIQLRHAGKTDVGACRALTTVETRVLKVIGVSVEDHTEIGQRPFSAASEQHESDTELEMFVENGIEAIPPSPSNNRLSPGSQSSDSNASRRAQGQSTDRETSPSPNRHYQRVRQRQTTERESELSIEHRRLRLDEMRERNETRRLKVDADRNVVLTRFADIAQAFLDQYMQNNRLTNGQRDNDSE